MGAAVPARVALDPGLLLGSTDDEILRCYVDLVRKWRGTRQGNALRLRQGDVAVLVSILGTDGPEIERRLIEATACSTAAAAKVRRLLLASLGGALTIGLAAATVGRTPTVVRIASSSTSYEQPDPTVSDSQPAISSIDRRQPSTTAVNPPASEPQSPAIAPANPRPMASDATSPTPAPTVASPTAAEATVSIPSLGIKLPVIEGGQAVIDEGVVAHYVAVGWKEPVAAGAPGTYWLAAHHVTHGGPFAALPGISVGAQIRIITATNTFIYTVTSTAVVGLLPGDVAIYGVDESSPVILLQTCTDDTHRFLVHGTLTAIR